MLNFTSGPLGKTLIFLVQGFKKKSIPEVLWPFNLPT